MEETVISLETHPSVNEFTPTDYAWCYEQARAWADDCRFEMATRWLFMAVSQLQFSRKKLEEECSLLKQQVEALECDVYTLEEELSMKD